MPETSKLYGYYMPLRELDQLLTGDGEQVVRSGWLTSMTKNGLVERELVLRRSELVAGLTAALGDRELVDEVIKKSLAASEAIKNGALSSPGRPAYFGALISKFLSLSDEQKGYFSTFICM